MATQLGVVVGIDYINNNKNAKVYRAIIATVNKKAEKQYDWKFECKMLQEQQVIQTITSGAKWLNIKLDGKEIKGSAGALSRFEDAEHKPFVIISQIESEDGRTLGYKVASYDGNVKNIPLREMIAYGNRISKAGKIPVQNAIFVPEEADKKAHYKSYPNCSFISEVIKVQKNQYTETKKVNINENKKTLNKLDEIYSKEQIAELKTGKANEVDIKIYANPALSAKQMKVLREGLESKLNVRPLAFPEYSEEIMKYYILDMKNGLDIRKYLNSKYSIGQINELSVAVEEGLDISKMANPKLKPEEMAEIRERLESNIWKDELIKKDGSWI
jgi:hypothetical protein